MKKNRCYEAQIMGLAVKPTPVKEIYFCIKCEQVVIRHRNPGSTPYIRWCCGNKMTRIASKCHICKMKIKGSNHFQGKHHLTARAKLGGTDAK
jgi:hypothetical protein